MSEETAIPLTDEVAFASLAALKAAHADLTQRRRAGGETPKLLDDITAFIRRSQATGALLDDDDERTAAQSLLNYWANILYRAGREVPDATLAEFDLLLAPKLPNEPCPYVGLNAFREAEHDRFFGRQQLVAELLERLKTSRLLAVVGSSGSGKSSLVRAGLIPALCTGALPGSAGWRYPPPIVPGSQPLESLERALKQVEADTGGTHDANTPLVLVVDQFEELFTLCTDEQTREAFARRLLELAGSPGPRNIVVLTMRIDFEDNVAKLPALQAAFQQNHVQVTALSAGDLRAAIEEPARKVGLKFEAGVVDALVRDILGERVGLPLLQFTLLKLWEQRERNRVTWAAYRQLGNAREALAHSADAFYQGLLLEEQTTTRRILLRMVRPDAGLEVISSRIQRAALYPGSEARDRIDRVLDKLITARLVRQSEGETEGEAQIEVAHEALIRNWPRLMDWIEQEREALRQRQRLTEAAAQWESLGRDENLLLRGVRLEAARGYDDLNPLEAEFVQASQALQERDEREREARRQEELARARTLADAERQRAEMQAEAARRLRQRAAILAVVAAVALVATTTAIYLSVQSQQARADANVARITADIARDAAKTQQQVAESARVIAETAQAQSEAERKAQLLAFQSLSAPDPELGLLLAIEAGRLGNDNIVEDSLRRAIQNSHVRLRLSGHNGAVFGAAWSPDQRRILTVDKDATRIWDAQTGQVLITLCCHDKLDSAGEQEQATARWSPNGDQVLTTHYDRTARVWDAATGKQLLVLRGHTDLVFRAEWRPSGESQRIVTASADGTVRVWDVTGKQMFTLNSETTAGTPIWSPDGQRILVVDRSGTARILDARTGDVTVTFDTTPARPERLRSAAWSQDGQRIMTAGDDGAIRLWNPDGTLFSTLVDPAVGNLVDRGGRPFVQVNLDPAFSDDGQRVAAGGSDGITRIWDAATPDPPQPIVRLVGHTEAITRVVWSRDGQRIATTSLDKTVRVWDAAAGKESFALRGHDGGVIDVAWSPDDQRLLTASDDTTARVWSANFGEERLVERGPEISMTAAALSPDRSTLAWGAADGVVWLWSASESDWKRLHRLEGHTGAVRSLAFAPDGKMLASAAADGTVNLWNIADGTRVREIEVVSPVVGGLIDIYAVAFAPDGATFATAAANGLDLWRTSDGSRVAEQNQHLSSIAFRPDGKVLATGDEAGAIVLRDATTLTQLTDPTPGHTGAIRTLAFSADGAMLASGGDDKKIKIWDVPGLKPRVELGGHAGTVAGIVWSDDGSRILSSGVDGTVRVWDVARGVQRSVLRGSEAGVLTAAWNTRELRIVAADAGGTARFYTARFEDLVALAKNRTTRPLKPEELALALGAALPATPILSSPTPVPTPSPVIVETAQIAPATTTPEAPTARPATWAETASLKHPGGVRAVTFSPDGTLLASAAEDGAVRLWSVADGTLVRTLTGHADVVGAVAFSPDGTLLASASDDKTVRIWNVATGEATWVLEGHTAQVWAIAFAPDGKTLASGSNDRTIRLWNVADGTPLLSLEGHTVGVWSVAFSPDGRILASAASDNPAFKEAEVRLWNVADGTLAGLLEGHTRGVLCVTFAPDGTLASGSVDKQIILWNVGARKTLRILSGHTDNVYSIAFTPDSRTLASGSLDNSVRLWSVGNGAPLQTLQGHAGRVWSVAFAPDGRTLASASADGSVRLWRAR